MTPRVSQAWRSNLRDEQGAYTDYGRGARMTPRKLVRAVKRDRGDVDGIPAVTPMQFFGSEEAIQAHLQADVCERREKHRGRKKFRCLTNGLVFLGGQAVCEYVGFRHGALTPNDLNNAIHHNHQFGGHFWQRVRDE